ncbi:hypothetical protein BV25DRAFT_1917605 [Artomyces pyxidatus]|uniref:Uncharacterized protein n=1 Tax=Artomyces pyxidatus TaxID=48021 RepID=A0ACB8SWJ9_9AGAM|nr:hypothetical protein BV25DRAFT_1917605 [Artomyces pyxidatus]
MDASREAAVSRVPVEILREIFSLTHDVKHTSHFFSNENLRSFALVNKRWHSVALLELYTHIYVCYARRLEPWKAQRQLYHSLERNPPLASMVRSIRFHSSSSKHEELLFLAQSICLCDNLVHFVFRGWFHDTEPLIVALSTSYKLQSVELSFGRAFAPLCSVSRFFSMLQGWKDIHTVIIGASTLRADTKDEHTTVVHDIACPLLRRFEFKGDSMTDIHLEILSRISPSISDLSLETSTISEDALAAAFGCWRDSLESLSLEWPFSRSITVLPGDHLSKVNAILAGSTRLHTLLTASTYVSPASLNHGFPRLATLTLGIFPQETTSFIDVLRNPNTLPSLRELHVFTFRADGKWYGLDHKSSQSLQDAWKTRLMEPTTGKLRGSQ